MYLLKPNWFCFRAPESQVQLGSRDGGADSRVFFLGLHRDANPGRVHILQAGCEQVKAALHADNTHKPAFSHFILIFLLLLFRPLEENKR